VLTRPMLGQRIWLAWCGGLNLAEFGFFFFLLAVVFCWLRYGLDGGYKYYDDGRFYPVGHALHMDVVGSALAWCQGHYDPPATNAQSLWRRTEQLTYVILVQSNSSST